MNFVAIDICLELKILLLPKMCQIYEDMFLLFEHFYHILLKCYSITFLTLFKHCEVQSCLC